MAEITTLSDNRKIVTTSGTAVALVAASTPVQQVEITAETDNTGIVVVGASSVVAALATRRGTPLNAGDTVTWFDVDLKEVYIDSMVNGDGVTFAYTAGA